MLLRSLITAVCVFAVPLTAFADAPVRPPKLDVLMTPNYDGQKVDSLGVKIQIEKPDLKSGQVLLKMPTAAVSLTIPAYDPAAIEVTDNAGKLSLTTADEPPLPSMSLRQYLVNRATVGDVIVRYTGKPRQVDAQTRNGPLYDLRSEAGGLLGAALYFMALPPDDKTYEISLDWDLSKLPKGMRGAWSLGEGRKSITGTTYKLQLSGFAVGDVKSYPASGDGPFALYWLSKPPFDMAKLAGQSEAIYSYMARFFKDTNSTYRVFARQNPYPAGGGSGWTQSFIFAYGPNGETVSTGDMQMMLAHEIAHNWPRLDDKNLSDTAWYTEGTAEYYSNVLAYRAKLITLEKFIKMINDRSERYKTNPFVALSNTEAGKIFWTDARAQRVPYGRGFMYFTRLNAQVQAKSKGKRSLDDLVLEVLVRQRAGKKVGVDDWRRMTVAELGEAGGREFDDMVAGKEIVPPANAFSPCLRLTKMQVRPFEMGFDEMSLTVVRGLRKGSQAEAAGILDGDKIVKLNNLDEARNSDKSNLSLILARAGEEKVVSYSPRGPSATVWSWEKTAAAERGDCKF